MSALRDARCRYHADREASARCQRCQGFYCRECVTEQGHAMCCLRCLETPAGSDDLPPSPTARAGHALLGLAGLGLIAGIIAFILYLTACAPASFLFRHGVIR